MTIMEFIEVAIDMVALLFIKLSMRRHPRLAPQVRTYSVVINVSIFALLYK